MANGTACYRSVQSQQGTGMGDCGQRLRPWSPMCLPALLSEAAIFELLQKVVHNVRKFTGCTYADYLLQLISAAGQSVTPRRRAS